MSVAITILMYHIWMLRFLVCHLKKDDKGNEKKQDDRKCHEIESRVIGLSTVHSFFLFLI